MTLCDLTQREFKRVLFERIHFTPNLLRWPPRGLSKNGVSFRAHFLPKLHGDDRAPAESLGGGPVLPENKKQPGTEGKRADASLPALILSGNPALRIPSKSRNVGKTQRGGGGETWQS